MKRFFRLLNIFLLSLPGLVWGKCELTQLPPAVFSNQEMMLLEQFPRWKEQLADAQVRRFKIGSSIIESALAAYEKPNERELCKKDISQAEKKFRPAAEERFDPRWALVLYVAIKHELSEFVFDALALNNVSISRYRLQTGRSHPSNGYPVVGSLGPNAADLRFVAGRLANESIPRSEGKLEARITKYVEMLNLYGF